MFACCVCGNHALAPLRKPGTHAGAAACLCRPVNVPDRSCMMVAYPGIHQVSEDSLLYRKYYRSTNLSKKQTHSTVFDSSMSKIRLRKLKFRYGVVRFSTLCLFFDKLVLLWYCLYNNESSDTRCIPWYATIMRDRSGTSTGRQRHAVPACVPGLRNAWFPQTQHANMHGCQQYMPHYLNHGKLSWHVF